MSSHPEIIQTDGPTGKRARLKGTGADVWEIIATLKDNHGDTEATAEYLSLRREQVEAADSYYQGNKQEIDQRISLNQREANTGQADTPSR